jgi:uncharacterized protein YbjT (DUF2867 family)
MILLTGATGLNGRAIVQEFARQQQPIKALVRSVAKAFGAGLDKLSDVKLVEADMCVPETLGVAFDGIGPECGTS